MTLLPYKAEHARQVVLRDIEVKLASFADFDAWAKYNEGEDAWTAFHGDTVLGCGGIRHLWEGVGEAWLLLGKEAAPHIVPVCRQIARKLEESPYHRVQAHARVDFPIAHVFLHKLGFEAEGYMRKYYPDECDAILYARVK